MHLVPAWLVPGTAAFAAAAATASSLPAAVDAAAQPEAADPGHCQPAAVAPAGLAGSSLGSGSGTQRRSRHAAKLSISDLMAGEGLLGRVAYEDGNSTTPGAQGTQQPSAGAGQPTEDAETQEAGLQADRQRQQQQQQQQQQQCEEMVLLDQVPQLAYARIKLCRCVASV